MQLSSAKGSAGSEFRAIAWQIPNSRQWGGAGSEWYITTSNHGLSLYFIFSIYDSKILTGEKKGYCISSYDIFSM